MLSVREESDKEQKKKCERSENVLNDRVWENWPSFVTTRRLKQLSISRAANFAAWQKPKPSSLCKAQSHKNRFPSANATHSESASYRQPG